MRILALSPIALVALKKATTHSIQSIADEKGSRFS